MLKNHKSDFLLVNVLAHDSNAGLFSDLSLTHANVKEAVTLAKFLQLKSIWWEQQQVHFIVTFNDGRYREAWGAAQAYWTEAGQEMAQVHVGVAGSYRICVLNVLNQSPLGLETVSYVSNRGHRREVFPSGTSFVI